MKPIDFPEKNVVFAEDQKEYQPLPAYKARDGQVVCCFQLSEEEKQEIQRTGQVWVGVMTFNAPLQPIFLSTIKSDLITTKKTIPSDDNNR